MSIERSNFEVLWVPATSDGGLNGFAATANTSHKEYLHTVAKSLKCELQQIFLICYKLEQYPHKHSSILPDVQVFHHSNILR